MSQKENFGARTTADQVLASKDLKDQTIIVTGANTGIGYETARSLDAGLNLLTLTSHPGQTSRIFVPHSMQRKSMF